jgi:hypothetical protein
MYRHHKIRCGCHAAKTVAGRNARPWEAHAVCLLTARRPRIIQRQYGFDPRGLPVRGKPRVGGLIGQACAASGVPDHGMRRSLLPSAEARTVLALAPLYLRSHLRWPRRLRPAPTPPSPRATRPDAVLPRQRMPSAPARAVCRRRSPRRRHSPASAPPTTRPAQRPTPQSL